MNDKNCNNVIVPFYNPEHYQVLNSELIDIKREIEELEARSAELKRRLKYLLVSAENPYNIHRFDLKVERLENAEEKNDSYNK